MDTTDRRLADLDRRLADLDRETAALARRTGGYGYWHAPETTDADTALDEAIHRQRSEFRQMLNIEQTHAPDPDAWLKDLALSDLPRAERELEQQKRFWLREIAKVSQ